MATSFPSSLDSFTNPSASDALDSVSVPHAAQHANLNDAMEAVQAKLGVGAGTIGEWQTWTPTFSEVTAQPSVIAAYAEVNKTVFWVCHFNLNGASLTAGGLNMSPPVEPADRLTVNYQPNGYGWVRPTGGGSWYTGTALAIGGSLDAIYFYTPSLISSVYLNPADNIDATTPITWTSSGYAWFTGWYEAK
jgi:hypothetical protein